MVNSEQRAKMLEEGKVSKVLMTLAIPGIVAMLVNAIYNAVDTMFVGMLGNTSAIGAVTVAFPLFMMITAIGQMFGIGGGSYLSRLMGQKNKEQADKAATVNLYTSYAVGILVGILVVAFIEPILMMFGSTDTILPYAKDYAIVLAIGAVFTVSNMAMNNMIRAEGNAKYSMIAIMIGAILNIILDPIFMFTFGMGVKGAAVATVVGQAISNIYLLYYYVSKKSYIRIQKSNFKPSKEIYGEILKVGSATLFRQGLGSVATALMNIAANPYGDPAVAAIGIAMRIFMIFSYVIFGYFQGFQPIAGYSYGAKRFDRLREVMKLSFRNTTIFCVVAAMFLLGFTEGFVSIFTRDAEVVDIAVKMLRAVVILFPFFGFQQLYAFLFQSIGRGREALILSVSRQGIFLIPAVIILPRVFGLEGLIFSQTVADFLTICVTLVLSVKITKELKECEKEFNSASV